MSEKILIVGGYGQVGRYVTSELIKTFSNKVVVAGRSLEKANSFLQEHGGSFEILKLDIYDFDRRAEALKNIKVVVMCLSPKNNDFAEHCIKNGVHYIDISPSNDIAQNLKTFSHGNENISSTCVLGVGLAPGLSNLLVKELSQSVDVLQNVNISLLLGLGEEHGKDGVKWLLDNINENFFLNINGSKVSIKPFIGKHKTDFIEPLGKRTAYRFNLADQFIVPQTLRIENVSSYFCYDSKAITAYVSILKRIGIFGLLKFKITYRFIEKIFSAILPIIRKTKIGTDIYSIQVDAVGAKNGKEVSCRISAIGNNNSLLTGQIAAFSAMKLFTDNYPHRVFYFEELFSLEDIDNFGICPKIEMFVL